MDDCIFCQIVAGRIPSIRIYEDKTFIVFMDINPLTEGHCLLITKKHYQVTDEVPDSVLKKVLPVAKKIAMAAKEGLKNTGYNFLQNNDSTAGQVVNHWHLHIIPRLNKNEVPLSMGEPADLTKLPFVAEKIREKIKH